MPERDYSNDYDAWMRDLGGDTGVDQGRPENPDLYTQPFVPRPVLSVPAATGGGGGSAGGGRRGMSEAEGRAHDLANGLIGGYMGDDGWVHGSPGQLSGGGGRGGGYFGNYEAPQRASLAGLNYPSLNLPRLQAPPAFTYEGFTAPSREEAESEPGFDYALKQGVKAYENSKAYTGTYKGGSTIKGINDYARNMASQNYGQVFERKAQTYDRNRNNAASNYMTNYGVTRDVFDRDYAATKDEFAPKARASELAYARDWDVFAYEGDDSYRRWDTLVNSAS